MAFVIHGYNVKKCPEYNLAPAQLQHAVAVIYGVLKLLFCNGKAKKHSAFSPEPLKIKTCHKGLHKNYKQAKVKDLTNPKRRASKDLG
jgi:hypothetical protein